MSEFSSGHNGDVPSSIAGVIDTGSMKVSEHGKPSGKPANFISTAKRESSKNGSAAQKRFDADMRFFALVNNMGPDTLHKPFLKQQLDDLRHDNKPDGHHSATTVWAIIAGAATLPYASDAAMDLLAAQNDDRSPNPVAPRLELDDAA